MNSTNNMPKIVTLDLECFYSTEYSLTKIPTEEYVRSPQFEMIGIAIKVDDGPTTWYPKPQVERILKEFDWSDAMVVAQNTAFDGAVLDWLLLRKWHVTLSTASTTLS
jgi:hypothetical protein